MPPPTSPATSKQASTPSYAVPMTFKTAIELNLFNIISTSPTPLSATEIITFLPSSTPSTPLMLDRILRLLSSHSILTCSLSTDDPISGTVTRRYSPSPVVKFLVQNKDGVSLSAVGLLVDKALIEPWYYLKDAVLNGGDPFNMAHGMTSFEYFGIDPRCNKLFNEAMKSHSVILMNGILEKYRGFDDVKVLVDVGGGVGATLAQVVAKHKHIKGINFDLPHVISEAITIPGVEHVGGDMFESVPSGDAIFMKWILHDWSDEHGLKILKNCWKALPANGKMLLIEYMLPMVPENTHASQSVLQLDMIMLVNHFGGKERSAQEFEFMAKQAGFSAMKPHFSFVGVWLIELYK
ncbi:O-methyltransferase COMT-type protein [Dioscorea alata]|uniref:O-methyltransferase COMT-type protein n=1 Tax=Dioscorea alata TaxID=55571 RepID=A0ACB7V5W4_DIOAL|nr:O-methyltransferase COMT-type protein [Dioscorea alata]